MKECPSCGRLLNEDVKFCPTCQYKFEIKMEEKKSIKPDIAGILMGISAVSGFILGILFLVNFWEISFIMQNAEDVAGPGQNISKSYFQFIMNICGTILIILSSIEIVGAIMSFLRKNWYISLLGAISGLFIVGVFFSSSILAFIALILIFISKEEFL